MAHVSNSRMDREDRRTTARNWAELRAQRSGADQLALLSVRPGESKKERARLTGPDGGSPKRKVARQKKGKS